MQISKSFPEGMRWFGSLFLLLIGCIRLLKHSRSWHREMLVWLMLRNNTEEMSQKKEEEK